MLRTGTLSHERKILARIKEIRAEIDGLNASTAPERVEALAKLRDELQQLDPDVDMHFHQGRLVERVWAQGEPDIGKREGVEPRPMRGSIIVGWARAGNAEDHRRKTFSDPLQQRRFDLQEKIRHLVAPVMRGESTSPVAAGLSEAFRGEQLAKLRRELLEVEREIGERDRAQAEASFEALRQPARDAAGRVKALQAKLEQQVSKLLPLEAELATAIAESATLAAQAEQLRLTRPSLRGRRVESPVGTQVHGRVPGQLIERAAHNVCRTARHLAICGQ